MLSSGTTRIALGIIVMIFMVAAPSRKQAANAIRRARNKAINLYFRASKTDQPSILFCIGQDSILFTSFKGWQSGRKRVATYTVFCLHHYDGIMLLRYFGRLFWR